MQTFAQALQASRRVLAHTENPSLEGEMLLCAITNHPRTHFRTHSQARLSLLQWWRFHRALHRRASGIPLAYMTQKKSWAGFDLNVSPSVLIPRDETEILCDHIKRQSRHSPMRTILDVGTGSGNISLFCAKHFPQSHITALDSCPKALSVARKNYARYRSTFSPDHACTFLLSDMLEEVPPRSHFDLIVANLPYLPNAMPLTPEVKKEPKKALFAGEDGLDLLRKFAAQIQEKELSFQSLWLEFLPPQKDALGDIFTSTTIEFFPDLGGDIFFARLTPHNSL